MSQIAIIGGGIIGAAIAYELSQIEGLTITLIDNHSIPAAGATGAALGVLMGIISHKSKGRAWTLREQSIRRYETLIPELEALTGTTIPQNRQGIVLLRFAEDPFSLDRWQALQQRRQSQGWTLELWDSDRLAQACPQITHPRLVGAVYSPSDGQINPTYLTQALLTAAQIKGVRLQQGITVEALGTAPSSDSIRPKHCTHLQTSQGNLAVDWVIMAAGLGSSGLCAPLCAPLSPAVNLRPVLGQALHLKCQGNLGQSQFQPVITGEDVHIVPLGQGEYWVGATVEFPDEDGEVMPQADLLAQVLDQAIAFCPALATGTILRSWSGKRPRPEGEPAPLIRPLAGYENVLLATGHYRNGVLLAPATALTIKDFILRQNH